MHFVFLTTLALYIPYSLLPETAMAHGISQVPQLNSSISHLKKRFKRSGFFCIFMRFVFLATLALYIPYSLLPETAMAHGISQVPQQNSSISHRRKDLKGVFFFCIFVHFVFLATLALYLPYSLLPETAMAHGIFQVPQQNSSISHLKKI
jgi:hypothetical protein